jgi:hypothetical protein
MGIFLTRRRFHRPAAASVNRDDDGTQKHRRAGEWSRI